MKYIKSIENTAELAQTTFYSPTLAYEKTNKKLFAKNIGTNVEFNIGIDGKAIVTITNTWNPNITGNDIKIIISGEVILNGKVDCYSIEFEEGGHLTINAGARLRIWEGGIVNNDAESSSVNNGNGYFTINSSYLNNYFYHFLQGELLIHPNVVVNNQPYCSVKIYTSAKQIESSRYVWQRLTFTLIDINNISHNGKSIVKYNSNSFTWWTEVFDYSNGSWTNTTNDNNLINFIGFQMTNNSANGDVIYTFKGKIYGNINKTLLFVGNGYFFFGNSYNSSINTSILLNYGYKLYVGDMINSIIEITNANDCPYIPPCGAFILRHEDGQENQIILSYKDLVWDPSFEEDETPVQTRGAKGGSSLPKSELPDDPIFKDPEPTEFENNK